MSATEAAGPRVSSPQGPDMGATLYRCPTPTNWLCPCGRVERELRRAGIAHDTVRVAARRGRRPEVDELTGQQRVPVVALEGEALCDSRRIVEHLRTRAGQAEASATRAGQAEASTTGSPPPGG